RDREGRTQYGAARASHNVSVKADPQSGQESGPGRGRRSGRPGVIRTMSMTFRAIVLVTALASAGCSTAQAIRENTRAIGGSSAATSTNTDAIKESTSGTTRLVPALEAVSKLEEPMRSLARLEQPMRDLSALSGPMGQVAALDPAM